MAQVKQFVLISDLKRMIVLVQTSVVYLILCTHSQMVGTNKRNVQLFEYESPSVNVQICCPQ